MYFSFPMFFNFLAILHVLHCMFQSFRQITGPTVFVSQFRHFQFPRHTPGPAVCISHFFYFEFSCHTPCPTVCISHFPRFWETCISHFHLFECFSPYSMSNRVCVSFSTFFCFLTLFQVLKFPFLIFHFFKVSSHIIRPAVCVSHFSTFQFSRHTPYPTLCIPYFARFWVFFAIFQVLQCAFLIFQFFQCFSP